MSSDYYNIHEYEHPSLKQNYANDIHNPITAKNMTAVNIQWLMDLIVDSRSDVTLNSNGLQLIHYPDDSLSNLLLLISARNQIETIISTILGKNVYFGLNIRNHGYARFNIRSNETDQIIVPTFDSLSTGEIALFNMFSTIVKYADKLDVNNSMHFEKITGIVVIDEIELHLHSTLQKEVLPKLLRLFPKVQFIITTHSPLFLLGMREEYGNDGFDIYDLPIGERIDAESFTEFQRAFEYMTNTQMYQEEIAVAIKKQNGDKPLIITEGATDWRHIKAAFNSLSSNEKYKNVFENLAFELFEYNPKSEKYEEESLPMLEMGCSTLCSMCDNLSKLKQRRKYIFIADCDDKTTNNRFAAENGTYKKWGNNVYSILLPIPDHRKNTPSICIEHYYSDSEIKTEVEIEGIKRRLYMGNEFDAHGRGLNDPIICEKPKVCGEEKINIIEGSNGEKVISNQPNSDDNLALPKMEFANRILKNEAPFDKINFDAFIELFRIINEIIKLS